MNGITSKIAVGFVTAPRPNDLNYLSNSLDSFWDHFPEIKPTVFAEPGAEAFTGMSRCHVVKNAETLGLIQNWNNGVRTLLAESSAPWIMMCEDDIELITGIRRVIEELVNDPDTEHTVYSPYCAWPNRVKGAVGWAGATGVEKTGLLGALCFLMPRDIAVSILETEERTTKKENELNDFLIGTAALKLGFRVKVHHPSLVIHTGRLSTFIPLEHKHNFHRVRAAFLGEDIPPQWPQ